MMGFKQIFTWWHNQTIGTFLKTIFFGKYVGKDIYGNRYYTRKKTKERWVIYKGNIESTKIPNDWYLWIHHTVDNLPSDNTDKDKFFWEKPHLENQTGKKTHKTKLKKDIKKKYESWK